MKNGKFSISNEQLVMSNIVVWGLGSEQLAGSKEQLVMGGGKKNESKASEE